MSLVSKKIRNKKNNLLLLYNVKLIIELYHKICIRMSKKSKKNSLLKMDSIKEGYNEKLKLAENPIKYMDLQYIKAQIPVISRETFYSLYREHKLIKNRSLLSEKEKEKIIHIHWFHYLVLLGNIELLKVNLESILFKKDELKDILEDTCEDFFYKGSVVHTAAYWNDDPEIIKLLVYKANVSVDSVDYYNEFPEEDKQGKFYNLGFWWEESPILNLMKHMKSYEKYMRKNKDFIDINNEIKKHINHEQRKLMTDNIDLNYYFDVVGYC